VPAVLRQALFFLRKDRERFVGWLCSYFGFGPVLIFLILLNLLEDFSNLFARYNGLPRLALMHQTKELLERYLMGAARNQFRLLNHENEGQ
jgi:hypothetical protein